MRPPLNTAAARQRGVVTLEYAFLLMIGILPLLILTFTGALIFAAKQSLALAAAEGSRAALRYGSVADRQQLACTAASRSMQWLHNFSGQAAGCSNGSNGLVQVSTAYPCESGAAVSCIRVTASYPYDNHPFIPGTGTLYGWTVGRPLQSQAVVQLGNLSP